MAEQPAEQTYLEKALEDLAGAESEYESHRYNTTAKLTYYSCFHAAVEALLHEGVPPPTSGHLWSHAFVQAEFVGLFIQRQKRYSSAYQDLLSRTFSLRQQADYTTSQVSETKALRMLRRTREFVSAVQLDHTRGRSN